MRRRGDHTSFFVVGDSLVTSAHPLPPEQNGGISSPINVDFALLRIAQDGGIVRQTGGNFPIYPPIPMLTLANGP